jgi:hypothetical protein
VNKFFCGCRVQFSLDCLLTHTLRKQVCETDEKRSRCLHGGVAKLATATLIIGLSLGVAKADQAGGQFGFPHPNFTGAAGAMTAQQFVLAFDAAMHNPNVFRQWIRAGTDIRKLNPSGVYLKHLSLRTIDRSYASVGDHPDYNWIHANHPEWILRDANGKTVPLFLSTEESLDFGNDAYLDWVLNTWMPNNYLDSTDSDPNKITWYLQDNGDFLRQHINCAPNDAICQKYTTDAGVQSAFRHMFDRFKARWPNKRILISTGTLCYMTPSQQLPWMEDVLAHADGYFSESLTNDHSYWNSQPNSSKRNALQATLQLADWLAAHGKYFYPNLGMSDGKQPTQAEFNYGYAFFNLLRQGDKQFFSFILINSSGQWQPRVIPEMTLPLGNPLETRQQIMTNVYRRIFAQAIAYVNLSDLAVSISLPAGTWKNSLGQVVSSPLTLASFSGLTVYGAAATSVAPAITTQPVNKTVTAPATATFSVVATGTPTPTYAWQSAPSGSSTFTAISGATSTSYTTGATTTAMSGTKYRCVITNTAGSVISSVATLTVNAR